MWHETCTIDSPAPRHETMAPRRAGERAKRRGVRSGAFIQVYRSGSGIRATTECFAVRSLWISLTRLWESCVAQEELPLGHDATGV